MANQSPLSGLTDNAGGYVLPEDQGDILVNAILQESAAISLAGDRRATGTRKTTYPIWLGQPTASFTAEAGTKPTTGAEFDEGTINIKKVASIILFTDEMLEDLQNGDVNVLVDSGIRSAISDIIDANALGQDSGANISTNFDVALGDTATTVTVGSGEDALRVALSAAMGTLEANGYTNSGNFGFVYGPGYSQHVRDARVVDGSGTTNQALYVPNAADPFYGVNRALSSNPANVGGTAGTIGYLFHAPNVHVRIRKDVEVSVSREATVDSKNLFEENLTALRYETRIGQYIHDTDRAVVALTK